MRKMLDSEFQKLMDIVPDFVGAVKKAKEEHAEFFLTTIDAFYNEPELMYLAVHYATEQGVSITFGA